MNPITIAPMQIPPMMSPPELAGLPSVVIGVCSIAIRAVVVGPDPAVVGALPTAVVGAVVELAGISIWGAGNSGSVPSAPVGSIHARVEPSAHP